MVGTQTDDTLFVCSSKFAELEEIKIKERIMFTKPVEKLQFSKIFIFNGGIIAQNRDSIYLKPKNIVKKNKSR